MVENDYFGLGLVGEADGGFTATVVGGP